MLWFASAARTLTDIVRRQSGERDSAVTGLELAEDVTGDARAVHVELHAGVDPAPFAALGDGLVGLSAQAADVRLPTTLTGTPSIADDIKVGAQAGRLTLRR